MNASFRKQIFGNILVSPTSNKYKENEIIKKLNESENNSIKLKDKIKDLINENNKIVTEDNQIKTENISLKKEISSKNRQIYSLNNEILELKNKTRIKKIFDLFK
jgi:Ser-tRNA(Ala) deacylase AlaX